jgi:ribosomal protein L7/L12
VTPAELAQALAALSLEDAGALHSALRARLAAETDDDEAETWASVGAVYGAPPDFARVPDRLVVLASYGEQRVRVIAAVRAHLALSPQQARNAVANVPTTFGP